MCPDNWISPSNRKLSFKLLKMVEKKNLFLSICPLKKYSRSPERRDAMIQNTTLVVSAGPQADALFFSVH